MKRRYQTLLDKSIAAMRAAVDIVNRPKYDYREEVFVILCVNAWELLIKAKWLKDHDGKISCLFVEHKKRELFDKKTKRYKKTRSGNPMTHELSYIIRQLNANSTVLDANVVKNIELLVEARDNATHFFNQTAKIDILIREVGLASIKNYCEIVEEWFGNKLEEFGFCLVPISIVNPPESFHGLVGNKEEKRFVEYYSAIIAQQDDTSSKHISIVLKVKIGKSSHANQLDFRIDPKSDKTIMISEEDRLAQFPLEYSEMVKRMKERYSDFVMNKDFHNHMKTIKKNSSCCLTRFLNPKDKKMQKMFYNTNVFQYFDTVYKKRK